MPSDPAMLMSFLNTKLRDGCDSLGELCDELDVGREDLLSHLKSAGLTYAEENNRVEFV